MPRNSCAIWSGNSKAKESTETANHKIMAVRAVNAEHVDDRLALGGIDDLAGAQQGIATRHVEQFGGAGIGGGGVDFLIGVAKPHVVVPFEGGEEGIAAERRFEQTGKIVAGEIAGFQGEGFICRMAKAFELDERAGGSERKTSRGIRFIVNQSSKKNS